MNLDTKPPITKIETYIVASLSSRDSCSIKSMKLMEVFLLKLQMKGKPITKHKTKNLVLLLIQQHILLEIKRSKIYGG